MEWKRMKNTIILIHSQRLLSFLPVLGISLAHKPVLHTVKRNSVVRGRIPHNVNAIGGLFSRARNMFIWKIKSIPWNTLHLHLGLMGICNYSLKCLVVSHILIFYRWLSNLFLNWLTFLASVTCDGKLFQLEITLCEKKNLRMLSPLLSPFTNNFCLCPLVLVLVAMLKTGLGRCPPVRS